MERTRSRRAVAWTWIAAAMIAMVLLVVGAAAAKWHARRRALIRALDRKDADTVMQLLDDGAPAGTRGKSGTTVLMMAARAGDERLLTSLLRTGADPNDQDAYGTTALMWAGWTNHGRCLLRLLASGARATTQNRAGDTALSALLDAREQANGNACWALLRAGADPDDSDGYSLLDYAIDHEDTSHVRYLVNQGVDLNPDTDNNDLPLYRAARTRRRDLFELLRSHGARVKTPDDPDALFLNFESPGGQSFRVARDRWTIAWSGSVETKDGHLAERASILKNGVPQERLRSREYAGLAVRRVRLPVPFPVIAARWHSGAGHGEQTRFYAIRQGRLVRMLTMSHDENGGPVLRRPSPGSPPEWVWDDNDWYTYYGRGPAYLLVYRLAPDGRLVLSRRIPNPSRKPLPRVLGEEMLQ